MPEDARLAEDVPEIGLILGGHEHTPFAGRMGHGANAASDHGGAIDLVGGSAEMGVGGSVSVASGASAGTSSGGDPTPAAAKRPTKVHTRDGMMYFVDRLGPLPHVSLW